MNEEELRMLKVNRWALCALLLGLLSVSAYGNSGTGVVHVGTHFTGGPDITITWTPNVLWPPDHNLSTITITATDNDNDPHGFPFSIHIDSISSNEDDAAGHST